MTDVAGNAWKQRFSGRALWVGAAAVAVWLGLDVGGAVVAPAVVEVRRSVVPSPATAAVKAVHVRPGDDVEAGALLVELDGAALDLELALAEAELERVRSAVRARQVDVKDQDFEVGLRLQADAERATSTLAAAAASHKQDEQELQSLGALIEKNEKLVKEQLASGQELDELRLRQATLRERAASAKSAVEAAVRLKQTADQRLVEWRSRPGHDDALLAPDAAAVVAQQERVKIARWRRELLSLRAPFRGRIEDVPVVVGDVVREGAPVVVVFDTAPGAATAWVAEEAAGRVRVGDVATLRSIDGRGIVRRGVVRALGGGIVEWPVRLRHVPGEPVFGRAVHVDIDAGGEAALPGQVFEASFASSTPARP
jgi:multidrug resistance efflux pump